MCQSKKTEGRNQQNVQKNKSLDEILLNNSVVLFSSGLSSTTPSGGVALVVAAVVLVQCATCLVCVSTDSCSVLE